MKNIAQFLAAGKYAIAGVSRDPKKFGNVMFKTLLRKGMDVVPVNPNAETIDGVTCYRSVSELPAGINAVIFVTPKEETPAAVKEALAKGIKNLWVQQGAESKSLIDEISREEINFIHNECIMMFWKPDGIHSFHRFLRKIFGRLPE